MSKQCDRIWVEGDLVFHEDASGTISVMTAEASLRLSKLLGAAGGDALMNRHDRAGRPCHGGPADCAG